MANPVLEKLIIDSAAEENGMRRWNEWRKKRPQSKPDLKGIDLSGLDMSGANFANCLLDEALLGDSFLDNCIFDGSSCIKTDFSGSKGRFVNFSSVRIVNADFDKATLYFSDADGTDFENSSMAKASLFVREKKGAGSHDNTSVSLAAP